jgi:AAHS family 4-hydroxybenzoate transporter-like MFS transporter
MAGKSIDVVEVIDRGPMTAFQVSLVVWLCCLMTIEGFDMQAMAYTAPAILKQWQVSKAAFGPVLSASLFGYMVGAFALGAAADRLGRKVVLLLGLATFGVFTLAAPTAHDLTALMTLRFLAGLGLGAAVPTGLSLNAEYVPLKVRATTIGLMYVAYNVGAAGGGFVAGAAIPAWGWPSVFYIGGVAPLLLGALMWIFLPESVRFLLLTGRRPQEAVRILNRLRPDAGITDASQLTVSAEEKRKASPASLFTDRRAGMTLLLWGATISSFMAHHFLTNWLPTVMTDAGLTLAQASVVGGMFPLGGAIGSFVVGAAMDRRGLGMVALAFLLGTPLVITLGLAPASAVLLGALAFLAGFLVLGGQLGLNACSATLYPTFMRSTGAGWSLGVGRVGSIAGPIVGGILITTGISRPLLFVIAATPLVLCAALVVALGASVRRRGGADAPAGAALDPAAQPVR